MSNDGELMGSKLDPIRPIDTIKPILPIKQTYTVSFCTSTYAGIGSVIVKAGQTVERPTEIEYQDCELVDWCIDRDLRKRFDFSLPVKGDITLYAKWVFVAPTHEVYFSGPENMPPVTVEHGSTVKRPPDPKREGHTFLGWYIADVPEEHCLFLFDTPITQHINLFAFWKEDK